MKKAKAPLEFAATVAPRRYRVACGDRGERRADAGSVCGFGESGCHKIVTQL